MFARTVFFMSSLFALVAPLLAQNQGLIISWGIDDGSSNDQGQVTDTPDGNDFTAVDAGYYHSIALRADGSIVAWGGDISFPEILPRMNQG